MHRIILIVATFFCLSVGSFCQNTTPAPSPLAPLAPFLGEWTCAGKFEGSGKAIGAHVSLRYDLNQHWIVFRHDDKPPFAYHALSQWAWDEAHKEFVMVVEDSGGGVRVFRAPAGDKEVVWTGDAMGSEKPPAQRFTFRTIDARHFFTSYSVLRGTAWILVDSSTCSAG
jgi:hypothetical protein